MFRLFADNSQCRHIFFAGCHDSGYSNLLTPYRGRTDRITLLKAANFHSEYERLGLPVRELPALFMSTPIGGTGSPSNHTPSMSTTSRPICKHFQKVRGNALPYFAFQLMFFRAFADTAALATRPTYRRVNNSLDPTIPPLLQEGNLLRVLALKSFMPHNLSPTSILSGKIISR